MGGRKLKQWLSYPLIDRPRVAERHEAVENLVLDGLVRAEFRELAQGIQDLERLIGRIALGRAAARDLIALRNSLEKLPAIRKLLTECAGGLLHDLGEGLDVLADVAQMIGEAIVDEPPPTLKEGGIFRRGFHPDLDELMTIMSDGKGFIAGLESRERERTGIGSLKIGFNRVFGYYIEVTRPNLNLVPEQYIRKQTLAGAERFITPELKEQEEKILTAQERRIALEQDLFEMLRTRITAHASRLRRTADALAQVDVLASLAEVAVRYDYSRPRLLAEDRIEIKGGRHPVIERTMKSETFVPNDLVLDQVKNQILIITGPNMAGKSTILRQAALICLMSQMGGFVPAECFQSGLVDRIFTRVGASDDLIRGRSTFMVEMTETAQILNQATSRSLVVLDEIGRGTSTFDGLSIAWAVAEYLHDLKGVGVRTLFATHYHELVELAKTKHRVKNFNVSVKEWDGRIIFLRKMIQGGASRSYGLAVARLAGLPAAVLSRAAEVLADLEEGGIDVSGLGGNSGRIKSPSTQLSLFATTPRTRKSSPPTSVETKLIRELRRIDVNKTTPLAALNKIAEWKELIS